MRPFGWSPMRRAIVQALLLALGTATPAFAICTDPQWCLGGDVWARLNVPAVAAVAGLTVVWSIPGLFGRGAGPGALPLGEEAGLPAPPGPTPAFAAPTPALAEPNAGFAPPAVAGPAPAPSPGPALKAPGPAPAPAPAAPVPAPAGEPKTEVIGPDKAGPMLVQMGLLEPKYEGGKLIGYLPKLGFDNLGGTPIQRPVGWAIAPGTPPTVTDVMQQTVSAVTGVGYGTLKNGLIDPNNLAIVVQVQTPGPWTSVSPALPAAAGPTAATPASPPPAPSGPTGPGPTAPIAPPPPVPPAPVISPVARQALSTFLSLPPAKVDELMGKLTKSKVEAFELARGGYVLDPAGTLDGMVQETGLSPAQAEALLKLSETNWKFVKMVTGL